MQVSVETTAGLSRRMTVSVPAEKIQSEILKRLKSMTQRVKVPGFRPGKVPFTVIEQRFGGQVKAEVIGDLLSSSYFEAVNKEKLRPAGTPKITEHEQNESTGLRYTAEFEVYPEFQVSGVEKIKIERLVAQINDQDVDNMLEKLRKQRATWKTAERAARADDRVVLDYKATINGEPFPGGDGTDLKVVIGSKSMIPGFEDALIGAQAGKSLAVDLTFPENYSSKAVAGKLAHFELSIKEVQEREMPALDAEFIASFGLENADLDGLKADVRKNMVSEAERIVRNRLKNRVMEALLEHNPIAVPQALVNEEAQRLAQQMQEQVRYYQAQGADSDNVSVEKFESEGRRRIQLGLILAEIIKHNGLKATSDAVRTEVERIALSYGGDPRQVMQWYYADNKRLAEIESIVLEGEVVDWVLSRAQVLDKETPFDQVVASDQV